MTITVNEELKALIPPLSEVEKRQFERAELGLSGNMPCGSLVILVPTSMSPHYWIWVKADEVTMAEYFSPRPVAASRLPFSTFEGVDLHPVRMEKRDSWPPAGRVKKEKITNLYLIQPSQGGPFKVGVSMDVNERLKQLQTGSPVPLIVINQVSGVPHDAERMIHSSLAEYRLHGEWFDESSIHKAMKMFDEVRAND